MRRPWRHWAFWPLLVALALRLTAIGWGLPASDGWDNDGVAPRDVYPGLVASFTPGEYYTYPPLHLAVLAVLSSPVAAVGVLNAPTRDVADIVQTMLQPSYMTWLAGIARGVSLLLSLATTWLVADLARRTSGPRAARFAAWAGAVNLGFTYYGKTSNLDAPCVFYTVLAVWLLARDQLRPNTRCKVFAALAAACAVTTKDQAYANFVLVLPVCVAFSLLRTRRPAGWLYALGAGALGFAVASPLLFNPSGFFARVAFLRGSASQDFVLYSADRDGRLAALAGTFQSMRAGLGVALLALAAVGVLALVLQRVSRQRRLARALPGLAALSFFLFFNLIARRGEDRFVLSQTAFVAFYVGLGVAWLDARLSAQLSLPLRYVAVLAFVPAGFASVSLDAAMLRDPRYEVERWLDANAANARIETYGLNVYLPRFSSTLDVTRVSPLDAPAHNPMPGLTEVTAPFSAIEARQPRFVVVPTAYTWRYLGHAKPDPSTGFVTPPGVQRFESSPDGAPFFKALYAGELAYRPVLDAHCDETYFQRIWLHASICEPVTVFERVAAP